MDFINNEYKTSKMKKNILQILIVALLLNAGPVFAGLLSSSQAESVVLITDRSIYIIGEQIRFFATVVNSDDKDNAVQSQVLYCEIITPDGTKIAGEKFLINKASASGCMDIPGSLLTGTYYFRAYTKVMRNNGPESYGYRQIRILNPGRTEIAASVNNHDIPESGIRKTETGNLKDMLYVAVDKNNYTARETVSLIVRPLNISVSRITSLCLSVVPESSESVAILLQPGKLKQADKADYFPETRGFSLSGKLTESSSSVSLSGKKVNLSIIGQGRDFMSVRTDSSGRFFFALPDYYGSRDLFVCTEKTDQANAKIWVDNDFCTAPVRLPSPEFNLSEQEKQSVYRMALNEQISTQFYNDTLPEKETANDNRFAFYDKPSAIIYLDKYVQLPTLEEYFNELPSQVKVRTRKGEKYFVVIGSRGLSFYEPLVLVDWVAVDEPSKILAVSPQNIARLEIVNEDYIKGGQTYGGIISIISKKGDFAGIDLPSTGIFINYRFLPEQKCNDEIFQDNPLLPVSKNTVFWKPGINIQNGNVEKFDFTAPETPGIYSVVVEGVTKNGEIFSTISRFEVGNRK